ncbi:uncharacterized protein isoform X3 [Salmo salar]|uniref:Uncharacterized protein isoform X3 n=1 Tax=Salmo salar TaxID=8030 RepID=A0A1S3L6V1_SALSA|nr:uncharacterized protein LOC106564798 isoform X3 [Salmo salar]|eukprot:XP_013986678.1 PREDICTED: uncharacterized protein LOC106564798 isoform X3 [Salmo salar]
MSTILYKPSVLRAEELKERSYLGLPSQLLPTLEELSTEELMRFQFYLTGGQLPGLCPVPESQLERADWRKTPQKYSPENAVKITVGILRRMNRNDLIEKLERDHRGGTCLMKGLDRLEEVGVARKRRKRYKPKILTGSLKKRKQEGPTVLSVPNLLLETLEKLSTVNLKRFQWHLTEDVLDKLPPIPESQLKNSNWQDTVDQIMQIYGPEKAVEITVVVLRLLYRNDLAEVLERSHRGAQGALDGKVANDRLDSLRHTDLQVEHGGTCLMRGLDRLEEGGAARKRRKRYKPKILTGSLKKRKQEGPTMLSVPNLLLETLEKLSTVKLKRFQWHLTEDVLDKLPPIPESQLKNSNWQDTVDQIMQIYGPEKAVEITVVVLRLLYRNDLAEVLERSHRGAQGALDGKVANDRLDSLRHTDLQVEHGRAGNRWHTDSRVGDRYAGTDWQRHGVSVPVCSGEKHPSFKKSETTWYVSPGIITPARSTVSCSCSESDLEEEHVQLVGSSSSALDREASDRTAVDSLSKSVTPYQFEPKTCDHENKGTYWFQCPHAGLFQCSITGLVFEMEGEGEVLYWTVPWNRRLLAQRGKRPAGPLFKFTCLQGSVGQLHLPHCELYDHVDKRSILKVLLLPSNVVLKEVREERRSSNGDREIYLETTSHCQLTPKQEYTLSTDLTDDHRIKPTKASFVDFQSYENYIPTFQLFMQSIVKEANIFLNENGSDTFVWDGLVWLPASLTEFTSTVLAPPPVTPIPPGRAFITKHRMALETRLGVLRPILLHLQQPDRGVLIDEEREEVLSKTPKTLQNQALLDMVIRKGARAQEHFYQALREADRCLVEDLEEQTA